MLERENKLIEKLVENKQAATDFMDKEELVKKILELHYGFLFDSGKSDRYKDYTEIDTFPEEKGKSR